MEDKQFIYAVARVRHHELSLLSDQFIDRLIHSESVKAALDTLNTQGWDGDDPDSILNNQENSIWDFVSELVDDLSVFDVFLLKNDCHNLKAAIKSSYMGLKPEDTPVLDRAITDPATVIKAVSEKDFSRLPESMQQSAADALEEIFRTHDGHMSDTIIDRATLDAIRAAGKRSQTPVLSLYSEVTIASSDIKIAVRGADTKASREYFELAIAPCDTLDKDELVSAALAGKDAVCEYLMRTKYADGVPELKKSISAFERWCDNLLIDYIKPQIHNPSTLGPVAAYILARQNEIKTVRIVISGIENNLGDESIRERVRAMYV
ncbi:MAG: V-type ATPase subunit [Lachnospiraceae bacterium]|nr:V-type ATPase subunit [Lachnospiraceae bacterium]